MILRAYSPDHLFHHWARVEDRIRESKEVLIFLDYDGTLVPIQKNPKIFLRGQGQALLTRLVANPHVTVVAISGRRRAELRRLMGIRGIQYLGLYGAENGRMPALSHPAKRALREAYAVAQNDLSKYPQIWIENKVSCFCVHLREAEATIRNRVLRSVRALVDPFRSELHLLENLRNIEIAPQTIQGKGVAVRRVLRSPLHRRALPLYFGDDFSDEAAFAELGAGISVLIGEPRCTSAQFLLRNSAELIEALSRVEEVLA